MSFITNYLPSAAVERWEQFKNIFPSKEEIRQSLPSKVNGALLVINTFALQAVFKASARSINEPCHPIQECHNVSLLCRYEFSYDELVHVLQNAFHLGQENTSVIRRDIAAGILLIFNAFRIYQLYGCGLEFEADSTSILPKYDQRYGDGIIHISNSIYLINLLCKDHPHLLKAIKDLVNQRLVEKKD
ncbi:MAG: hypothetical protein Tsb0021_09870 [Chlamydiales bacterium]